jgi:hypothetical protein
MRDQEVHPCSLSAFNKCHLKQLHPGGEYHLSPPYFPLKGCVGSGVVGPTPNVPLFSEFHPDRQPIPQKRGPRKTSSGPSQTFWEDLTRIELRHVNEPRADD